MKGVGCYVKGLSCEGCCVATKVQRGESTHS